MYKEVDKLISKYKVSIYKIKPYSRKYSFKLLDIPRKVDYLKLLYPYNKPALLTDISSKTYLYVFGTNTALFEQFVI